MYKKDILSTRQLKEDEISHILHTADSFYDISKRDIKKVPSLRGKTVINLFYEPSTRTRTSFEIAGKRLSSDVINISASISSTVKGETLLDTVHNLESMNPDILVIRHPASGAPAFVAERVECSVINAGDGSHEHPTQALLDLYTIKKKKDRLNGLNVLIVGDILHSRVARSNIYAMKKMGMKITVAGPPTLMPAQIEKMGVTVTYNLKEAVKDKDVIMMLRIQLERQDKCHFPTVREYAKFFCLTKEILRCAKKDVLIMHPGPVNRGVEISSEVCDGEYSVIREQVTNGVAVRMALLFLLMGYKNKEE